MDPVMALVTAVATVAAAKLKQTIQKDIEDAYERMKELIHRRYKNVDLESFENDPESKRKRSSLEAQLRAERAGQDRELVKQATALLDRLASPVGYKIEEMKHGLLIIRSVKKGDQVTTAQMNSALARHWRGPAFQKDGVHLDLRLVPEDKVQFTSYYPTELKPEQWYTMLAYVHVERAKDAVHEDSKIRLGEQPKDYRKGQGRATQTIARGTEIVAVPELPGCRFNPAKASVRWLEDWHRIEFRMQPSEALPGFVLDTAVNGRLSFYVGSILVADIKLWAHLSDDARCENEEPPKPGYTSNPYQAVFVSYSHKDSQIVQALEKSYLGIGLKYLRDVHVLRSGEQWKPALLKKIDEADIFQLYWSTNAKKSPYVKQEWRRALELKRESFIRPMYWERPMPPPPRELASIYFYYYDPTVPATVLD
jgi:hypothetical protein